MRKESLHDREVTPAAPQEAADARPVRTMRLPGTAGGATLQAVRSERRSGEAGDPDTATAAPVRAPIAP